MINLLPTTARRRLTLEYWVRVLTVWLIVLTAALVVVFCALLPPYVLVTGQEAAYEESAAAAEVEVAEVNEAEAQLTLANLQARRIIDTASTPRFTDVLAIIKEASGSRIELGSFQFARGEASAIAPVTVNGVAATRVDLANFRNTLAGHPRVEAVELPISNLASDRDLAFSIKVTIVPTDE